MDQDRVAGTAKQIKGALGEATGKVQTPAGSIRDMRKP